MERSQLFKTLAVGTNIAMGFSLEESLAMLSGFGVEYVELSSIAGMCEHVDPKQICDSYCEEVKQLLDNNNLKCLAVAGHVDLTLEDQLQDFLKKVEFTSKIGAKYINTNSGPLERFSIFKENIKRVIEQAEKWNVTVCLESHGDIIRTAKGSSDYIREINHPLIKMNYDTGNTYFYEKGNVDLLEDISSALDILSYIHLKDISIVGDKVNYQPIGKGDISFAPILKKLNDAGLCLNASLEIPVFVEGTVNGIGPKNTPLTPEKIREAIKTSFDFTDAVLNSL